MQQLSESDPGLSHRILHPDAADALSATAVVPIRGVDDAVAAPAGGTSSLGRIRSRCQSRPTAWRRRRFRCRVPPPRCQNPGGGGRRRRA